MTMKEMLDAVKAHARDHYEDGGWDYVVEGCFDNAELIEIIGKCRTAAGAIKAVGKVVKLHGDYRAEIEATAW